jgi:glucose/arabinose dehydrogenase
MKKNSELLIISSIIILILIFVFMIVGGFTVSETIEGSTNHDSSIKPKIITDDFVLEEIVAASAATDIIFLEDGRMLWSELNSGKIMQFKEGSSSVFSIVPNHLIPSEPGGEAGVMGMAVDSEFEKHPYIYVYYTSNGTSKIVRFEDVGGVGRNMKLIFDDIVQGKIHNGGSLIFGEDNLLYVSTGDATKIKFELDLTNPAQNITSRNGKILRMTRDGEIPEDNLFENSFTFALGVRNPYGFDFNPANKKLYVTDQGIDCCEEITILNEGDNSGWPFEMGAVIGSIYKQPLYSWDGPDRVSPTGFAFYDSDKYIEYNKMAFMTTWKTSQIYLFEIDDDKIVTNSIYNVSLRAHEYEDVAAKVAHEEHGHFYSGLLDIEVSPDGEIFFSDIAHIFKIIPKNLD